MSVANLDATGSRTRRKIARSKGSVSIPRLSMKQKGAARSAYFAGMFFRILLSPPFHLPAAPSRIVPVSRSSRGMFIPGSVIVSRAQVLMRTWQG